MSIKVRLFALFMGFTVVPLVILSALSLHRLRNSEVDSTLSRLDGMAEFKATWVEDYFGERMADLEVARNYPIIKQNLPILTAHAAHPEDPVFVSAHEAAQYRLNQLSRTYGYHDIILASPDGLVLCATDTGPAAKPVGSAYPDPDGEILAAARAGAYLSAVHEAHGYLGVSIVSAAAPVTTDAGEWLGSIIFEIDLSRAFLMVGDTKGLGESGEMVLAAQEGDTVRFLSPLRDREAPPGTVTIAFRAGEDPFPAQEAVLGRNGHGFAADYQGNPVIASWRYLPSLKWGLVVKIDISEALAQVAELRAWVVRISAAMIVVGAVLAWVLGQTITRPVLELHRGADIVGQGNLGHLIPVRGRDEIARLAQAFNRMTERLREVTASRDELNAETAERRRAEAEASRARRALLALSACNEALVRAERESDLLTKVCRTLVEQAGYLFAWIGYKIDDEARAVQPVAQAGYEDNYLDTIRISWGEDELGRGPTGTAIRAGRAAVCQDTLTDPAFAPWREGAVRRGFQSSLALPLRDRGTTMGALMVYSREAGSFNEEEVELLTQLADDLSYGIGALRMRAARERAEQARQSAETELAAQRTLSIRADRMRSLGEMAAGMAHELNQPLSGVRGLAEHMLIGLEREWDLPKDKLREKLALIMGQADRMTHVIDHVRKFARGQDGLSDGAVEVSAVIEAAAGLLISQLSSRGLRLELDLADGLPPVLGNPFSLEEVVINLINNARDALEEGLARGAAPGSALIRVRTFAESRDGTEWVMIEVRDNGPGMAPEVRERIFTPFFSTKPVEKGTGLGLAISRSIIEKYRGVLTIAPGPGGGVSALIALPALAGDGVRPGPAASRSEEKVNE